MNPILLSGAVSIGGKLINRIFGDNSATKAVKAGFEQELNKSEESGLLKYLKSQGVLSFDGVKTLDGRLVAQLKAMPGLSEKLSGYGPGDVLNLKIENGNLITIEDADGSVVATIAADTEAGALARRIHQLRSMGLVHADQPEKSLAATANQVAVAQTLSSAQWSLNPFAR